VYRPKTETRDSLPVSLELHRELRRWRLEYAANIGRQVTDDMLIVPALDRGRFTHAANGRLVPIPGTQSLKPYSRQTNTVRLIHKTLAVLGYNMDRQEGMHTLRRSGGLALYNELAWNRGHDGAVRIVQSMYGHSSLATTERYLRLSLEAKRRNDMLSGGIMFPERVEGTVTAIGDTG